MAILSSPPTNSSPSKSKMERLPYMSISQIKSTIVHGITVLPTMLAMTDSGKLNSILSLGEIYTIVSAAKVSSTVAISSIPNRRRNIHGRCHVSSISAVSAGRRVRERKASPFLWRLRVCAKMSFTPSRPCCTSARNCVLPPKCSALPHAGQTVLKGISRKQ